MIPRDTFRDEAYWDRTIDFYARWIPRHVAKAQSLPTESEHRCDLLYTIFRERLEVLVAHYSRGDSIRTMSEEFPLVVTALAEYYEDPLHEPPDFARIDSYVHALWLLSLSILLEVSTDVRSRLVSLLDNIGRDEIYERLSTMMASFSYSLALLYPRPYEYLLKAIDGEPAEIDGNISQFLNRWYRGMRHTYWHNTHILEDGGFFGYWCFELAAFVKLLQIPDDGFSASPYYPADLLKGR